jgi:hypothetical protein
MKRQSFGCFSRSRGIPSRIEWTTLPYIDSAIQASGVATQLERTWKHWRATRGLPAGADPVAACVGYSPEDPLGQARVVINVDAADALLFAEMISYLIASRPLGHPEAGSGPWPSGLGMGSPRPPARCCGSDHEINGQVPAYFTGQVPGQLSPWDLGVPSPDSAEAERPIMRRSTPPAATLAFSQPPVQPHGRLGWLADRGIAPHNVMRAATVN